MVGRAPRLLVVVDGFVVGYDTALPLTIHEMEAPTFHETRHNGVAVGVGFAEQVAGCRRGGESQQSDFASRSVRAHSLFKRDKCVTSLLTRYGGPTTHDGDKGLYGFVFKGRELGAAMPVELAGFVVKDIRRAKLGSMNSFRRSPMKDSV